MRLHPLTRTILLLLSVYTLIFSTPDILSPIYGSIFFIHELWLSSLCLLSIYIIPLAIRFDRRTPNKDERRGAPPFNPPLPGRASDWLSVLSATTLVVLYRLPHTNWIKALVFLVLAPIQLCVFVIATRDLDIVWTAMNIRPPFRLSMSTGVIIAAMFVAPVLRHALLSLNLYFGLIPLTLLPARFLLPMACVLAVSLLMRSSRNRLFVLAAFMNWLVWVNTHSPFSSRGEVAGFKTLARAEGPTGYISVLESMSRSFRALRADQSLLGGVWLARDQDQGMASEPLFNVFVMLEAIRLVEPARKNEKALVIGLGIGTLPSAFIAHGVNTTVVELDGTVVRFAKEFFRFKSPNPVVVDNALSWVPRRVKEVDGREDYKYDMIVHDVFTGGAEPEALFTSKFLGSLSELLREDGKIAINYAGDLNSVATKLALQRILSSFTTCRMFRDSPAPFMAETEKKEDFANMVVFCKKTAGPITFRRTTYRDFLGTTTRENWLVPKYEVDVATYLDFDGKKYASNKNRKRLATMAAKSAAKYRNLMRETIPGEVWDAW